jgi:gas vesicle protein
MLNKLYLTLGVLVLFACSHFYAYQKGASNRELQIVTAQQKAADKEVTDKLIEVNQDLSLALQKQDESEKRALSLSATLSSNQNKIQELQKALQDANQEVIPACNKLTPGRYKLYQSLYNQEPTNGTSRDH